MPRHAASFAALALAGAASLVSGLARADAVAVVPPSPAASEGQVRADAALRAAVVSQGHRRAPEEPVARAVAKVADGVVDTRAEYKTVAEPLAVDWVVSGRFTPFLSGRPGFRAEVEAYQVRTGRVESLSRDVDARVAEAQLGELLRYLLRPEGVGAGGVTFKVLPPPEEPVKDPPPELPKESPKEPPKEAPKPPPPAAVAVTRPVERVSPVVPYGSNHPLTVGGALLVTGALARPAGARGSSLAGTLSAQGGYVIAPDDAPGLELRGELAVGVFGVKAFHGAAGARYLFPLALDSFLGPEAAIGAFRPFGGDRTFRFLARGGAVFVQRLAPETQLEAAVNLYAAPGGTGAIVLGGASLGGSFRF